MSEGRSFHGPARGRSDGRVAALVGALVVGLIGLAVAKPWASPAQPTPSGLPSGAITAPSAAPRAAAPAVPSAAPTADIGPLPVAFTTPLAPASPTWSGLQWRRLAPDDPLSLVTSATPWRGGFVAVGSGARSTATPVWTSDDGSHWDPLPFGTGTTFWPSLAILGVAERPAGLVALTQSMARCDGPCPPTYIAPVMSWTSPDGRTWAPHVLPPAWLANTPGRAPLPAVGPGGLVVASSGEASRLATSTDGSDWQLLPAAAFPARFALDDLRGTATGYVAVGQWVTPDDRREAASLWSGDGRHWSAKPAILPTTAEAGVEAGSAEADMGSAAASLVAGPKGVIAVGRRVTTHGADLWWQSSDGRHWRALPRFHPLGRAECPDERCPRAPNGALVGDGLRMIALRGGAAARAWTSADGRTWSPLRLTGDLPDERATRATLLPGGVLLSDGTTTWFGEALGP